ncbi:unnamed protein product [Sphenostylis stenocarpa]|uniref:Uncharacterized protein n=1 Tax=Sphenostylis stenocarpa TaxID=92480 RepID=A0AA86VF47_9FABA|nr:unnamed protein product [Sphenostylis stenocarpa]
MICSVAISASGLGKHSRLKPAVEGPQHDLSSVKSRAVFFFMAFFVGLMFAAGVKGQTSEFPHAPAPAPTMDAGAGFLVTYSGAFVFSSLLLSLIALLCH